jgi:hypothetical protein
MGIDTDTDSDLLKAVESILKVRYHLPTNAEIRAETFYEIIAFLHQFELGLDLEQSFAADDLSDYGPMGVADWLHTYDDLLRKAAHKLLG